MSISPHSNLVPHQRLVSAIFASSLFGLLCGCTDAPTSATTHRDASIAIDAEVDARIAPRTCLPIRDVSGSPRTIEDVVTLINALPTPVTLPCFLENLARPLRLFATKSVFSAQPAAGERSPRIFIFLDPLILSVVPEGDTSVLLELSVLESDTRSLKGEIPFPVTEPLEPSAPYDRLLGNEGLTSCGFCHREEQPAAALPFANAYISDAIRPQPISEVDLADVREQHRLCDADTEPERCDMLRALFDYGEIERGEFPPEMPTFF